MLGKGGPCKDTIVKIAVLHKVLFGAGHGREVSVTHFDNLDVFAHVV